MNDINKNLGNGRTWADLISTFSIWILMLPVVFYLIMIFTLNLIGGEYQLGLLGTAGQSGAELPSGTILAIAGPCPSDDQWKIVDKAKGRFLVGAGDILHNNYVPGQSGGSFTYDHHAPNHHHALGLYSVGIDVEEGGKDVSTIRALWNATTGDNDVCESGPPGECIEFEFGSPPPNLEQLEIVPEVFAVNFCQKVG